MRRLNPVKVVRYIRYVFILLSALAVIYNFISRQWEVLFTSILTLILYILPTVFIKRTKIRIPAVFQIVILLFIFGSMYLGEIHHYYYRFPWWDSMLHAGSAVILAYIGFLLIYTLNRSTRMHVRLSPLFMALFSFCFAITIGCLWEIFEFVVDIIWGANMQKARGLETIYGVFDTRLGVIDTMRDLIMDTIGALFVSVIGYLHITHRKDDDSAFWSLQKKFIETNPELFDK